MSLCLSPPRCCAAFGGQLTQQGILEFVDSGRNVLLAASPVLSETMRSLASECGVDFDDKGTQVFDHFSNTGDHSLIVTNNVVAAPAIVGSKIAAPVLYRGLAHSVPNEAELISVALSGNPTTYSADPKKSVTDSPLAGPTAALVSAMQVRTAGLGSCANGQAHMCPLQHARPCQVALLLRVAAD